MRFELKKWYLDCTAPDGSAFIGYAAALRWGWIPFHYGAVLLALPGLPPRQRQSFSAGAIEHHDSPASPGLIAWRHPRLRVAGEWTGGDAHAPVQLYSSPAGGIEWRCLAANAQARVALPDGAELCGHGYAECLHLTLPPWRLPFKELRWGRFISDHGDAHRVWIDWRGGLDRRWAWSESGPLDPRSISEQRVDDAHGSLLLTQSRSLRDAPLAGSLLGGARLMGRLLPNGLGRATESKWLSRGLLQNGPAQAQGWAIHEVVKWR